MIRTSWRRCCAAAVAVGACLGLGSSALGVGDVVISQVWGGTASATGTANAPNADYVELFNRTANPISLNGWSLNVDTPTGTSWTKFDLPNVSIAPFSYYLVRVSAEATNGNPFTADAVFPAPTFSELSSTTGKVALRSTTTAIGAVACPPFDANLVDLVTYGTSGTCREGSTNAPPGSLTSPFASVYRIGDGCIDTDQNGADFIAQIPSPRNSFSPSTVDCNTGACCNVNTGACTVNTSAGCSALGGTYQGNGSLCSPNPCPPTGACCTGTTGSTCSVLTSAGCAAVSGFYQGNGSTCSPTPCSTRACCFSDGTCCNLFADLCTAQGGMPNPTSQTCTAVGNCIAAAGNDLCSNAGQPAFTLSAGTAFVGNNFNSTSTDGPSLSCQVGTSTRTTKGVWFTFTPASTSTFDITSCGSLFDNGLEVFVLTNCADPSTWNLLACDDDNCPTGSASFCGTTSSSLAALIQGVPLTGGVTYHIRLTTVSTSATGGGNYTVLITDTGLQPTGACCTALNGYCQILTAAGCAAQPSGLTPTYLGDGAACSPNPCGGSFGACCTSGGACQTRTEATCLAVTTNTFQGVGTVCFASADVCVLEACCNATTGACTLRSFGACTASEIGQGEGTTCTPTNPCPPSGACCNPCTFVCSTTVESACTGTWNSGQSCTPANICNTFEPVPANDAPCGAIALTAGVTTNGVIGNASAGNDGANSTCDTTTGAGVWYSFSPATSGFHSVSTCGATFDTVLTVFTGDCNDVNTMTIVACDADTCVGGSAEPVVCGTGTSSASAALIEFVQFNVGTTYYIRVQHGSATGSGGSFPVLINTTTAGACCTTAGACTIQLAADCTATTEFYAGDNVACGPGVCPASGACCNDCTFACTLAFQTNCGSGSTFILGATSCSPTPCSAGPAPANDLPCGAISLTPGMPVTGTLASATSTDDGPAGTCQTNANKGVWYRFNPATTGDYTISTCGSVFDTVITVFTGDCAVPASLVEVACDDDTCPGGETAVCGTGTGSTAGALIGVASLSQGVDYLIRVQVFSTGVGGTFTLVVQPAVTGACCDGAGNCTIQIQPLCSTSCGGSYGGDGTLCSPNPCTSNGIPDTCATAQQISGHFVGTFDNSCAANENDEPADTCNLSGVAGMQNSYWFTFVPGADGTLSGSITEVDSYDMTGALYSGSTCGAGNLTLVCCYDQPEPWDLAVPESGSANVTAGVRYYLVIGDWGSSAGGGQTSIDITIPGPPPGACCAGAICSIGDVGTCTGANTFFAGAGTSCNVYPSNLTPCCFADFNHVGGITVQDIFDFLAAYFSGDATANINGGGVSVQDIFDYLAAYFAGGC